MAQPLFPVVTLPPGTTSYNLVGLSAGQSYTAVVAHKEDPPSAGYTQPSQVSWTESATVGTVEAPDNPVAFALLPPLTAQPVYGFGCYNNEPVPGTAIVVQMAVETSPGSGTFGSWITIDVIAANPQSWVIKQIALPSDGCNRAFQAQAQRAGTSASAFTPTVTLLPGTSLPPADYPIAVPAALLSSSGYEPVDVIQPSGMTVAILSAYTPPTDHDFSHMEYIVAAWTGTTWGSPQVVVGSNQGSDTILAQAAPGGIYQVTPVTVSAGGTGIQVVPGVPLGVTRNQGSAVTVTVPALSNAPVPTLQGINATTASYTVPFDTGTAYYMVYAVLYTSNPGSVLTVESPANTIGNTVFNLSSQIYPPPGGATVTLALGGLSGTNTYIAATFVPYNQAGVRGVATTIVSARNTTTAPSAPTLSFATFPGTGGTNGGTGPNGGNWNHPYSVGIKVTFVSNPECGRHRDALPVRCPGGLCGGDHGRGRRRLSHDRRHDVRERHRAVHGDPNGDGLGRRQQRALVGFERHRGIRVHALGACDLGAHGRRELREPNVRRCNGREQWRDAAGRSDHDPVRDLELEQRRADRVEHADRGRSERLQLHDLDQWAARALLDVGAGVGRRSRLHDIRSHANEETTSGAHVSTREGDSMDPDADRREGEDRQHDSLAATALKVVGSPVSIIVLVGGLILAMINVVQKANNSLPEATYYRNRDLDSLRRYNHDATITGQLSEIQLQIGGVRTDISEEHARTDSIIRLLRRSICRANLDACP